MQAKMSLLLAVLVLVLAQASAGSEFFTVYSNPVVLHPSEVYNRMQEPIPLPEHIVDAFKGKTMGIRGYTVDIVERHEDGSETQAPLYDVYNHHFLSYIGNKIGIEGLYNYSQGHDPLGPTPDTNCSNIPTQINPVQAVKSMHPKRLAALGRERGFFINGSRSNNGATVVAFGGNSGAEYRNNPHRTPAPYAYTIQEAEYFGVVLHFINTKKFVNPETHVSPLLECPCTPQRVFDYKNHTIDGHCPAPPFYCNKDLLAQKDTGCHLETYHGGYRCCGHGLFLSDTSKADPKQWAPSTYFAKFTFEYFDADAEEVKVLTPSQCCDVTSDTSFMMFANIEYDVPPCSDSTPRHQCIHVETSVEQLDSYPGMHNPEEEIELVYAVGHLHTSGIGIDLIDDVTGDVICHSEPIYGTSDKAGDEKNYIVGILPCIWDTPLKFKRNHPFRTIAYYNNTTPHHGVMSLWLMSVAGATY